MLFDAKGWSICLNQFSSRYTALKNDELIGEFGKAVRDPLDDEASGIACVVDSDVDRRDQGAVQRFLMQKYEWSGVSPVAYVEFTSRIRIL